MTDSIQEYKEKFEILQTIAANLKILIADHFSGIRRIDRITARAKSIDSFTEKAYRINEVGNPHYDSPLVQIQDQIGARIIVFYKDDIEPATANAEKYFRHIEEKDLLPDSLWEFGYFGRHLIMALPTDVISEGVDPNLVPRFFELQIKTLFQHAWSESNHDLGYKPTGQLSQDQLRRLAFTSAQAWGADRVFQDLHRELVAQEL